MIHTLWIRMYLVCLASAVVSGKSGLATFGGDLPEHLLPKPLADYAATLFRP